MSHGYIPILCLFQFVLKMDLNSKYILLSLLQFPIHTELPFIDGQDYASQSYMQSTMVRC